MASKKHRSPGALAWTSLSFTALAVVVIALAVTGAVTLPMGLLMLIGLVGIYVGGGVLVLVYRFVAKLR